MMNRFFCLLAFLLITGQASAVNDTLNRSDKKHRKIGFWVQYLDSTLNPTDSANAFFFGYEKFDDEGLPVYEFKVPPCNRSGYRFEYTGAPVTRGKPVLLNGIFRWYYTTGVPAGLVADIQEYRNGRPFYMNFYHRTQKDTASTFNEVLYFDRLYNGIDGTFYYEEVSHHYEITNDAIMTYSGYFRKGKKSWHVHGTKTPGLKEKYGLIVY